MSVKVFHSLGQFAEFLEARPAVMVPTGQLAIGVAGNILMKNIKGMYGSHDLPELSPATQADREKKGYTPDDPLLRDGQLLRDSLHQERGEDFVVVGSAEPVAAYHEYGYVNARTGQPVPPRAAFREGLRKSIPEVAEITQEIVGVQIGVAPLSARLTELSVIKE